jgi:holo-[acyl-carrier protein] synthase
MQKQNPMIVGVGIDIIEIERVAEKILRNNGFRKKVFSENEIAYCESNGLNRMQHYAARFAAKEAFLKATGQGLLLSHDLNEIEVTVNDQGKPSINLTGALADLPKKHNWIFHLSLSHIQSAACAVVVIEV